MQKIILFSGDLAAGKTTIARILSKKHNIPYFSKDEMKEINCDAIGYTDRASNKKLSIGSVQLMLYSLDHVAITGEDMIIEANFSETELTQIYEIAKNHKYEVLPFFFMGDLEILYARFMKRLPTRHIAHKSHHLEESIEKYKGVIFEYRELSKKYPFQYIDTTKLTESEVLATIEKAIKHE